METLNFVEADGTPLCLSSGQILVVAKSRHVNLCAEQQWLKFPVRDDVIIMCTEKNFIFARIPYRLHPKDTEIAIGDILNAAEVCLQGVHQMNVFVIVPVDSQRRKFYRHATDTRGDAIKDQVFSWSHDFFHLFGTDFATLSTALIPLTNV